MDATQDILFEEIEGVGGDIGVVTLNRPEVLNSLNLTMIHALHTKLQAWAVASHIKAVVIRAVPGRAFCAGGDLRFTYGNQQEGVLSANHFFRDEYQLNRFIYHFPKPYIAFLDGITMGGGVGISIHGSHRVATERLLFAMPETGIGFFPDVGGTFFLPRLPGSTGAYLGLTGARLASDDCVSLGLVNHKVKAAELERLLNELAALSFEGNAKQSVSNLIATFKLAPDRSALFEQQALINGCFSLSSIEAIIAALECSPDELCQTALTALSQKSPTSLKVTLKAIRAGSQLPFDACMRQEYRLATRFNEGHDFREGIRALIIDKDHTPQWEPNHLSAVTSKMVDRYFEPLADELI